MMDRFSKGLTYAMIPSGIAMLLMTISYILLGFLFIVAMHGVAIDHMFPAEIQYTVINQHYGTSSTVDLTPEFNLYPLFWCLVVDSSILLGICGFFKINISTALTVVLLILFAPITIPIIVIMFFISKCKNNTVSSTSSKSYSAPKYSKSNHSDLADKF